MADAWEEERESLLDYLAETHEAFLRRSEWAQRLAGEAPGSGCHQAALEVCQRANRGWIRAREHLEDHDYERDRPTIEAHRDMVRNLQVATALARMDHLLGPGWLEEGE
jgi:hypothetical protein